MTNFVSNIEFLNILKLKKWNSYERHTNLI